MLTLLLGSALLTLSLGYTWLEQALADPKGRREQVVTTYFDGKSKVDTPPFRHLVIDGTIFLKGWGPTNLEPTGPSLQVTTQRRQRGVYVSPQYERLVKTRMSGDTLFVGLETKVRIAGLTMDNVELHDHFLIVNAPGIVSTEIRNARVDMDGMTGDLDILQSGYGAIYMSGNRFKRVTIRNTGDAGLTVRGNRIGTLNYESNRASLKLEYGRAIGQLNLKLGGDAEASIENNVWVRRLSYRLEGRSSLRIDNVALISEIGPEKVGAGAKLVLGGNSRAMQKFLRNSPGN